MKTQGLCQIALSPLLLRSRVCISWMGSWSNGSVLGLPLLQAALELCNQEGAFVGQGRAPTFNKCFQGLAELLLALLSHYYNLDTFRVYTLFAFRPS